MKGKVWRFIIVLFLIALLACFPGFPFAGEVDILVRKLVEKGVLTKKDAEGIIQEIRGEAAKQEKEKKEEPKKAERKETEVPKWVKEIPEWVKNLKFKGDLRLRYQVDDRPDDNIDPRHRGRFRLRLGAETKITDEIKVGFGITSGSGDPRSLYVTFENTFEKKNLRIDYAFVEYSPTKWLSLTGGKFQNPLWRPYALLWEPNITPEGAAMNLHTGLLPNLDFFFNTGFFVLDERSSDNDPTMFAFQPVLDWKITKDIDLTLAIAYYLFNGVKGNTLDNSSNTNTRVNNKLKFDFDAPVLSGAVAFTNPAGITLIPRLWMIGEYVYNPDPDEENEGYLAGLGFGHPAINQFGDWQFQYTYRRLEKDAWPDVFPESGFFGGGTSVKGHEAYINFGLLKSTWLNLQYYRPKQISGIKQTENLFRVNFNFKF